MNAGNNLSITSGRDATLHGAQVSGEKVVMDVGRDLTLSSQQDEDYYDSKQQSVSAGGSISFSGGSGSVNASRDKMHSSWQSVQEQTGVFAGSGGYDITVGKHTQLDGAVSEGHAEGTTKAAVSEGSITVRDTAKQQQDVSTLNRDTEHANDGSITPIFNKEKEQKRLQQAQLVSDIAGQALDIYNTHEATKATREATAALGDKSRQAGLEERAQKALEQGAAPYLAGVVKTLTTQDKQYSELSAAEKANYALLGGVHTAYPK